MDAADGGVATVAFNAANNGVSPTFLPVAGTALHQQPHAQGGIDKIPRPAITASANLLHREPKPTGRAADRWSWALSAASLGRRRKLPVSAAG